MSAVGSTGLLARSVTTWFGKGVASIGEQGVNSLSAFVLQIVLLRLLGLEQYGAFSIAFATLLLAAAAFGAIGFDPLPIVAGRLKESELRRYVSQATRLVIIVGVVFALLAAPVLYLLGGVTGSLGPPLWGALILLPFTLLFWTLRRGCYLLGQPGVGVTAGIVGAIVTFGLIGVCAAFSILSPLVAFIITACAASASSIVLFSLLRIPLSAPNALPTAEFAREHWNYGRWILGTAIAFWALMGSLPILATSFGGLEAAGAVRAYLNLITPLIQIVAALTAYMTPIVARVFHDRTAQEFLRYGLTMSGIFLGIAIAYSGSLWLSGRWLVETLYGREALAFLHILPAFVFIGIIHCTRQGAGVLLTASGRTDRIFFALSTAAIGTLAAAAAAGYLYGLSGAAWAYVGGLLILSVLLNVFAFQLAVGHAGPTLRSG